MSSRTVPTEVKAREAAALKAIYEQSGQAGSQRDFGATSGIGSAAMVWQYLNGHRPLNMEVAAKFATHLKVPVGRFSPRLAIAAAKLMEQHASRTDEARSIPSIGPGSVRNPTGWPFRTIPYSELLAVKPLLLERLEKTMRQRLDEWAEDSAVDEDKPLGKRG